MKKKRKKRIVPRKVYIVEDIDPSGLFPSFNTIIAKTKPSALKLAKKQLRLPCSAIPIGKATRKLERGIKFNE